MRRLPFLARIEETSAFERKVLVGRERQARRGTDLGEDELGVLGELVADLVNVLLQGQSVVFGLESLSEACEFALSKGSVSLRTDHPQEKRDARY